MEMWLLNTSYKTKFVVFQNSKSAATFDQYFTLGMKYKSIKHRYDLR